MFRYYLLGVDTAATSGLYARLCYAFLVLQVRMALVRTVKRSVLFPSTLLAASNIHQQHPSTVRHTEISPDFPTELFPFRPSFPSQLSTNSIIFDSISRNVCWSTIIGCDFYILWRLRCIRSPLGDSYHVWERLLSKISKKRERLAIDLQVAITRQRDKYM